MSIKSYKSRLIYSYYRTIMGRSSSIYLISKLKLVRKYYALKLYIEKEKKKIEMMGSIQLKN